MLKSTLKLSCIAILILILVAIPSQLLFNDPEFQRQLSTLLPKGMAGLLTLFILLACLTAIGLPRQIAAFVSGFTFDVTLGFFLALFSTTAGCIITLLFSRQYLHKYINTHYQTQQRTVTAFLSDELFYKAIVIRILPIGSNFLTNIIAGVCKVNKRAYVGGSFIGFIPQMLVFSFAGAGIKLASSTHLYISGVLFIFALALSYWLYCKHKKSTTHLQEPR